MPRLKTEVYQQQIDNGFWLDEIRSSRKAIKCGQGIENRKRELLGTSHNDVRWAEN